MSIHIPDIEATYPTVSRRPLKGSEAGGRETEPGDRCIDRMMSSENTRACLDRLTAG